MRRSRLSLALFAALAASGLHAQDQDAPRDLAPILEGSPAHGVPGARAGTERWVVHFAARSFDLVGVRDAVQANRPAAEIARMLADIDQRMRVDQAGFVADVQRLGGRVVQQWWIVNAAAIEIAPGQLAAIRALPGVRFVQPDVACAPAILKSTNGNNHAADTVQSWGYSGQGAAIAVIDSGHDENMNGSGRPHRTYFVDGNPANLTGGGIGGSRLLCNRQVGAMPADDVDGHGTCVASVAAGENWGIAEADKGHAPRAGIAGYAIADNLVGTSSFVTMAAAWQLVALDRAANNIVAANHSYSSTSNPLSVEQQALDAIALNFDVVCVVAAGNNGASTSTSQAAVNGIAVGAVTHDTHQVWASSAVGPLFGDPTRSYPDLAACGVNMNVAAKDIENAYVLATGTSLAAPQVSGAATQLRARFPSLTALQTKAILLASARDIGAQNPGLTQNHFGMGLLRNDRAHQLAGSSNYGSGTVGAGVPHVTTIPVVAGRTYSIAIAWFRHDTTSAIWSNLDLTVRNGATLAVLATATSPRNLYEMVRVTPTFTGSLQIETSAVSLAGLGGGPQPFSWAWADSLLPARDVVGYGVGCPGSGQPLAVGTSWNPAAGTLTDYHSINGEYGFRFPSAPQTFDGIEFYAKSSQHAATVAVTIRPVDFSTGAPDPLFYFASARATAGSSPGWCRALFSAPVTVSSDFYVCIDAPTNPVDVELAAGGVSTQSFYRSSYSIGPWLSPTFINAVSMRTLVRTAGGGAVPHFRVDGQDAGGAPTPPLAFGTTTRLKVSEAMANTVAISVIGFLEGAVPLAPLGASSCTLLASLDILTATAVDARGEGATFHTLPAVLDAFYLEVYAQYAVLDPANPLGLVFSNGLRLTLGP